MNASPQGQGTNYQINLGNEPSGVSAFLMLHPPSGSSMDIGFDMNVSEDYQAQVRVRQYLGSGSEYEEALGWTPVQMGGQQQYNIQLNQAAIAAGGKTLMELRFTKLDGGTFAQNVVAQVWSPWKYVTSYVPESRVARVCDGKENYRFGFNGMEKDNETKGPGNSLDFGERIYDSRLGKFLSLDPDRAKYPSLSPYSFAADDPIRYIDEFGKGPGDKVVMFSGALLVPGYQKPTSTMYHIMDKVSKFTGATGMYHTSYPLGMFDDNKSMIKDAVADIKAWKAANPDGKLTVFGYSYGGVAAMDLTRALDQAGVKVDLLITLDAADGQNSNRIDRTIPGNVVKNINYYQTNAKETGSFVKNRIASKGGANRRAQGNTTTLIRNVNETNSSYYGQEDYYEGKVNHYNIDDKNKDKIVDDVRETEGEPVPTTPSKCVPEKS